LEKNIYSEIGGHVLTPKFCRDILWKGKKLSSMTSVKDDVDSVKEAVRTQKEFELD
jgi:hypothetical protein